MHKFQRSNVPFLRKFEYPEGGKRGKRSTVFLAASMDVRVHRGMIDKWDCSNVSIYFMRFKPAIVGFSAIRFASERRYLRWQL